MEPRGADRFLPVTAIAFEVLLSLAGGEAHGYRILTDIEKRTGGRLRPHPGTLYREIARLVEQGLLEELDERPDPERDDERRRYYGLTVLGRRVAAAEGGEAGGRRSGRAREAAARAGASEAPVSLRPSVGGGPRTGVQLRLYRVLLLAYPASFRRRYGDALARCFADRLDAIRGRGRIRQMLGLWPAAAWDAIANGIAERVREAGLRRRADETPSVRAPIDLSSNGGVDVRSPPAAGARRSDRRKEELMDGLWKDVRFALRQLVRNPGFAAVAVLTIGLGIGANTAIFSVVQAVLLRPLPYAEPDRLVMIWGELTNRDILHFPSSPPDLKDIRDQSTLLEAVEGVSSFQAAITDDAGEPEQIELASVTPGFLAMLGVRPLHGRLFEAADATPAPPDASPEAPAPPIILVLSHSLWQRRYGGDPGVVGRSIETAGGRAVIIGVLPAGVRLHLPQTAALPTEIDAWFAPRIDYATASRNNVFLRPVGRLRNGVQLAQAQAELSGIAARLTAVDERKTTAGYRLRVAPLHADLTAGVRPIVLALLGAVGFVLLIACANVSNLLLVRAAGREREIAVRSALGGSRFRIVRQMLAESLVLAVLGGVLGVGLAVIGVRALLTLQPGSIPRLDTVTIDGPVLAYTAAAAGLAALVFGALPALHASRQDLARSLKDRGHAAGARAHAFVRAGVVMIEVALSLVLLIGAGLMLRSFAALRDVDPGFDAPNALTFAVSLPPTRYTTSEAQAAFDRQFQDRLAALPGVESVTATQALPLSQAMPLGPYGAEAASVDLQHLRQAYVQTVLPGYFETMRTRIIEGRALTPADHADSAAVVVVDRVLAEKTWPGESAVGKRLLVRWFTEDYIWVDVIGVAEHQRHTTLVAEELEALYYADRFAGSAALKTWVLRTVGDPLRMAPAARAELNALDPLLPMSDIRPLRDYVDRAMGPTQFALALIGIFAIAALVLAAVGLYGVIAYMVRQRTAEIGVRMAFGARPRAILEMIIGEGLRLTAVGILLGLAAAFALTRVLASQLVDIEPTDPPTFVAVAIAFALVAALACYVPARRATRVDPLVALREE